VPPRSVPVGSRFADPVPSGTSGLRLELTHRSRLAARLGDAPEGVLAYPAAGVMGMFRPAELTPASWIQPALAHLLGPPSTPKPTGTRAVPGFNPYDPTNASTTRRGLIMPPSTQSRAERWCPAGEPGGAR